MTHIKKDQYYVRFAVTGPVVGESYNNCSFFIGFLSICKENGQYLNAGH